MAPEANGHQNFQSHRIKEIDASIHQRFPGDDRDSVAYRQELVRVCVEFVNRRLADLKFVKELTSGQDSKFWSSVSEALLADRLRDKIFPSRPERGKGPDFLVQDGDRKIWIEVVCPEPKNVPDEWLEFHEEIMDVPHKEIILRWTAAIKEKAEKLIGCADGKVAGYLQKGVVASDEPYVIAVNGCQLRNGSIPAFFGVSGLPFAVEAVLPIGPYQLRINKDTRKVVERGYKHRPYVINQNGAQVAADTFWDQRFSHISAIWAVDLDGGSAIGNKEPMVVVHNPKAVNPIATEFLPADNEYIATITGQ